MFPKTVFFITLFLMRVIKKGVTIVMRYFMDYILRTFPNLHTFIVPEHQIYYTYSFFSFLDKYL